MVWVPKLRFSVWGLGLQANNQKKTRPLENDTVNETDRERRNSLTKLCCKSANEATEISRVSRHTFRNTLLSSYEIPKITRQKRSNRPNVLISLMTEHEGCMLSKPVRTN